MEFPMNEIIREFELDLDSEVYLIPDTLDYIELILKCEERYEIRIFDEEIFFFENQKITFRQLHYFILFLKNFIPDKSIVPIITANIEKLKLIRPSYLTYIREYKLNQLEIE